MTSVDVTANVSAEVRAYLESMRDVDADATLGHDPWRPLHEACDRIHVTQPKSDADMQRVAELWGGRSGVELRVLGYALQDLECLRHFRGLQRLNIQCPTVRNIDGLRHVAGTLEEFTLANTTARLSLRPAAECRQLRWLHLQRQKKDFAALQSLTCLRYLGLSGASLPDLSALLPFEHLQSLFIGFCKPLDLGLLGRFAGLQSLYLLRISDLHDLSALQLGRGLERIELAWLPHVEALPDLSGLSRLEEVEVDTMKSLSDISGIAKAPALRFLGLWGCPSLTPQSFECLRGHPSLKRINYGIGSVKKNGAVERMFPEEMTQPVFAKIASDTVLQRPTP